MEEKKCTKCGIEKPLSKFSTCKKNKTGKKSCCKECDKLQNRKWREANPEKHKENCRKWQDENPEEVIRQHWFRTYKGTYDQWEDYRTATNCSCCGVRFTDTNKKCQDHNHDTGEIRDVICRFCNDIEGKVKDHPDRLANMIGYLNKWKIKSITNQYQRTLEIFYPLYGTH